MTITNGYCTLAEVRARLELEATSTSNNSIIEANIEAVSRWIDHYCGRKFYANTDAHYYTAEYTDVLFVGDDIISIDTMGTDSDGDRTYETTWTSDDYDLMPYNAAIDGWPYSWIETTPNGDYAFPKVKKGVKIEGTFGWTSAPDAVNEACIIQATRIYKRKDSPLGIAGVSEFGNIQMVSEMDADVKALLEPYRRQV